MIGNNNMVTQVGANTDAIGYVVWTTANFAPAVNMKYLTVDSVDPLLNNYAILNGAIPQTAVQLANVTLSHVADGTYPIWTEDRFVSYAGGASAAATLATLTQSQVTTPGGAQPDFITTPNLLAFHAHFSPVFVNFNVGNVSADGNRVCGAGSNAEDGGDVGGLVFTLQTGADYCVLKGNYGVPGGVGPTSTSSFGVRQ